MKCRTDKTAITGDEALLREWLEAVRGDIESAAPDSAVPERPSGGYAASAPVCHVVAGANGSGKTTFALHFLPRYAACLEFVNPERENGTILLSSVFCVRRSLARTRTRIWRAPVLNVLANGNRWLTLTVNRPYPKTNFVQELNFIYCSYFGWFVILAP
ncbi:MAG: hypothetical protein PHV28_03630 [Kiritimatiellae bacterium]|nr:hypothetical protein [Kiritimatiellia bacterium]